MKRTFPLASIDCFRGFAVLVARSHLCMMTARPPWLRHPPDGSLTFSDLDASWFSFAITLTHSSLTTRRTCLPAIKRSRWRAYDGSRVCHDPCLGGKKYPTRRGAHAV